MSERLAKGHVSQEPGALLNFLRSDADRWDDCDKSGGNFRRTLAAPRPKMFARANAEFWLKKNGLPFGEARTPPSGGAAQN